MNPTDNWMDLELHVRQPVQLKDRLPAGAKAYMVGDLRTAVVDGRGRRLERTVPSARYAPGSVLRRHDSSLAYVDQPQGFSTMADLEFSQDAEQLSAQFSMASHRGSHHRFKPDDTVRVRVWFRLEDPQPSVNEDVPGRE